MGMQGDLPMTERPDALVTRRTALAALFAGLAPAAGAADENPEAAVRQAIAACVAAWNTHDVKAWSRFLAEDVWYTEADDTWYQRYKGRDKVIGWFEYSVKNGDLQWTVDRIKVRPDGIVAAVIDQRVSMLPVKDGKYASVFVSKPSLVRWRRDADGQWRIVFFTSHKGWALVEMKKDGLE
jgi:ketosteroid isomerase-like protein